MIARLLFALVLWMAAPSVFAKDVWCTPLGSNQKCGATAQSAAEAFLYPLVGASLPKQVNCTMGSQVPPSSAYCVLVSPLGGSYGYGTAVSRTVVPDTCEDVAGTVVREGHFDIGTSASNFPKVMGCFPVNESATDGCMAIFAGSSPSGSALVGGVKHYYAYGTYTAGNQPCTIGPADTALLNDGGIPSQESCAEGEKVGTINGKKVCYTPAGEVKADKGDGVSETKVTMQENADGSKVETKKTIESDSDGNRTTTTTVNSYGPDGALTGSTTRVVTSDSGSGGGSGGSGGDGGEEDGRSECEKSPDTVGCMESGTAPDPESMPVVDAPVSLGSWGSFGPSTASCPTDTITVAGRSLQIRWDVLCTGFGWLRPALLACCLFIAVRIFVSGVKD